MQRTQTHTRPVSFLNPTSRRIPRAWPAAAVDAEPVDVGADQSERDSTATAASPAAVYHLYRTRDNRKGRHAVIITPQSAEKQAILPTNATNTLKETLRGVWKMVVRYPVFDISYDVAISFTIGSVVWVVNGFFVWLPIQYPATEFSGEVGMAGGITAFIGATIFEIGSVLLMLEAINEDRTECFGWALEEAIESRGLLLQPDPEGCTHNHQSRKGKKGRPWEWWPTWSELKTHYLREIGFLACLSQFIGATIFWIAGFTSLSPIYDVLSTPVANGVYWLPQVVGGTGFIVSSWLFMLETQTTWYTPAPKVLGWHIGLWNLIGAFGFTICGALGFASHNEAASYASILSTFIGSLAFLIASLIQWFESLNKYPVAIHKT